MTSLSLTAVAVAFDLAILACACAAGLLLARGTRMPAWAAAIVMLVVVRAISMATAHAWETPSASGSFPTVDIAVGATAATYLVIARRRDASDAAHRSPVVRLGVTIDPPEDTEAHVDAA